MKVTSDRLKVNVKSNKVKFPGGERGIRTLGTAFGSTHDFQSCSFSQLGHLSGIPLKRNTVRLQLLASGIIPSASCEMKQVALPDCGLCLRSFGLNLRRYTCRALPDQTLQQIRRLILLRNPKIFPLQANGRQPLVKFDKVKFPGGEGGIRTHDPAFNRIPLFESGAFSHSATSPGFR